MSAVQLSRHNVIASFRDRERADEALEALGRDGFAPEEVSLLGQPIEDIDAVGEHEEDAPVDGGVGRQIAAGVGVGGLGGGVAGLLIGAAVSAIPGVGPVAAIGLLAGTSGAAMGATVGGIVEGESAMRTDHSWDQTFEAIKTGAVVVGVHSDDPERIATATATLNALNPMELHRVNDSGTTITDTQTLGD